MKKKQIAIVSSIIVVLIIGITVVLLLSGGRFDLVSREKVKKFDVINGNTGNITAINVAKATDILEDLYQVSGKSKKVPPSTGWLYTIVLYDDTSVLESIEMISEELWKKDGTSYSVKNGEAVIEALIRHEK